MLRQIEKEVLSKHQLYFDQPWFKFTPLAAPCDEYIETLKHTASSRVLALTRRTSQQRALLRAPFTFAPPPLEALVKLRARRERPK